MNYLGLAYLPISITFSAYLHTKTEIPLFKETTHGFVKIKEKLKKGTEEYKQAVQVAPGYSIRVEFDKFLKEHEIRNDLVINERLNSGVCGAEGTNYFTGGDAFVFLAPGFYKRDEEACRFIVKHELGHIKANDNFTIPIVLAVCSAAAAVFAGLYLTTFPAIALVFAVSIISKVIFIQYRERAADDFAIKNSTDEELKGGVRFMRAMQNTNKGMRNTLFLKIFLSSKGENRWDIEHPSLESRIKAIQAELIRRNTNVDHHNQLIKILRLTRYLRNAIKKIGEKSISGNFEN